jgi:peptidoglycan/xylan/chitin deacetylase (PgdA/CDA1 family)
MHGRAEILKYWYSNPVFSSRAIDHAFKYISAVTEMRFIKDRSGPLIWRSDDEPAPESVIINLGQADVIKGFRESYSTSRTATPARTSEGDPIEEIIKRLSLKAMIGPVSEEISSEREPDVPRLSRLVTSLVDRLCDVRMVQPGSRSINLWPNRSKFAVTVTHDVDIARRSVKGSLRLLWHKDPPGRFKGLVDSVNSVFSGRNPYDRIPQWLTMEKQYGLRSTFFVFAGRRMHSNDPKYRLSDLSNSVDLIRESGSELALHSGIASYSGDDLSVARSGLEDFAKDDIAGLRPHYLSTHLPEYWRAAAESGFAYSSCLGFDNKIGYFEGIDLPFIPFDAENDSAVDIVEIPITVMDCGLVGNDSADSDDVFERARIMIDSAVSSGGLVVLDWHQRTLYDPDYPGWGRLFKKLVEYALGRKGHFTTMREISTLLKERMAGRG